MSVLPWRVRKAISDRLPLLYHLVANAGTSGNSVEHWNERLAATWNTRDWPTKTERIRALTRPDEAILDVGCGSGGILRTLAEAGYTDLGGVELSGYAVERLRREGIPMQQGTLLDLPVPTARYDVVIASQVLEHVIRRGRFMREILRVLKPGGRAFIFVPNDCLGPIDESEHVIKYTDRSLRAFLGRYFGGIEIDVMRDANYEMSILFARTRKVSS